MSIIPHHRLQLIIVHEEGDEEWLCPICGRRFAICWEPFKKRIIVEGDLEASHSASKGGWSFSVHILQQDPAHHENDGEWERDSTIDPWLRWMRSEGLADD